jgi:hypothetical protein
MLKHIEIKLYADTEDVQTAFDTLAQFAVDNFNDEWIEFVKVLERMNAANLIAYRNHKIKGRYLVISYIVDGHDNVMKISPMAATFMKSPDFHSITIRDMKLKQLQKFKEQHPRKIIASKQWVAVRNEIEKGNIKL